MGWIFSEMCHSKTRLDGKTAVVTGCNTGIGKETVLEFYKRGARVVMACRNVKKAEEAIADIKTRAEKSQNVGSLVVKELDLGSFDSVRKCANDILQTESAIHLLVNNADVCFIVQHNIMVCFPSSVPIHIGIMACPKYLSKDGIELQFATNHLGHFLLTLLLLPRIIKSAPARIVIVSSSAHKFGDGKMHFEDLNLEKRYSPWGAYGRSKLANILFAAELGRRLKDTGVTTYSLHPGVIATELGRHVEASYPWTMWLVKSITNFFIKTPVQGAQTTLYCSLDEKCANETGLYYAECAVANPVARARKTDTAEELYNESVKLVKLEHYNPFTSA